jgi:hypothetical protein
MKITEPGVYSMPAADYHADACPTPSLSSSGARKLLSTCPARFWYDRNNPPEPSEALDIGSAAHEWLLEGETWPLRHGVLPEDHNARTKAGKEAEEAIVAAGKRPLKWGAFEQIKAMVEALKAHPFAHAAFRNGKPEQSLFWQDEETGIWCRARPDWLPTKGTIITDYKTTRSANPDHLSKAITDYGYHQQAEWYMAGARALGLIKDPGFVFVFQEKEPPYLVTVAEAEPEDIYEASILNRRARHLFARCLRENRWPGYADDVIAIGQRPWARKQFQERKDAGLYEVAAAMQAPLSTAAE